MIPASGFTRPAGCVISANEIACAFAHVDRLRANCAASGECLGDKYLWASDLILIDDTSRASIEAVIRDLVASGDYRSALSEVIEPESDAPGA